MAAYTAGFMTNVACGRLYIVPSEPEISTSPLLSDGRTYTFVLQFV